MLGNVGFPQKADCGFQRRGVQQRAPSIGIRAVRFSFASFRGTGPESMAYQSVYMFCVCSARWLAKLFPIGNEGPHVANPHQEENTGTPMGFL